jgi:hypothetical protein
MILDLSSWCQVRTNFVGGAKIWRFDMLEKISSAVLMVNHISTPRSWQSGTDLTDASIDQ